MSVLSVLVVAVPPVGATPAGSRWPPGVTVVTDSPLPPRNTPALVAMGNRLLVFGGGLVGEGVSNPELHRDAAILDLTTRKWRTIAPSPFPFVAASGVWSGSQVVVVGAVPNCSDGADGTGCPTSSLGAAVYTIATNTWRAVRLPKNLGEPNRWFTTALHWTGSEALFSLDAPDGIAIRPSDGAVRPVSLPASPQTAGECDTGSRFVSIGLRNLDGHARLQPVVTNRTASRAAAGPSFDMTASGSPWSVACTSTNAIVASGDGSTIARYNFASRRWTDVSPLPSVAPCTIGSARCEQYRFTGHDDEFDTWLPGGARALRYVTKTGRWADVAPGPGTDASAEPIWVGNLAVATRFDPVSGADTGELVIWRPV